MHFINLVQPTLAYKEFELLIMKVSSNLVDPVTSNGEKGKNLDIALGGKGLKSLCLSNFKAISYKM